MRCSAQLTDVKALQGNVGDTRFVLGFLSQLQEGQYGLEDLSGSVLVDLTNATRTAGLFTGAAPVDTPTRFIQCALTDGIVTHVIEHTENCVVVAEGVLDSEGVFQVAALGFPPLEPRADAVAALKVRGGFRVSRKG